MESRNVKIHRAGHEAFNRRDFRALVEEYAETISWTDHARGITFGTPQEFEDEFLEGWIRASSDCQVTDARYADAGDMVVARFTCRGTNDGPFGPFPATGKEWVTRSTLTSKETKVVDGEEIPVVHLEISSYSHPFWTGKLRVLDSDGKIDRFKRRYAAKKK